MNISGKGKIVVRSDPDVVPFIDIILVLLVIFMVISPLNRKGVDMILPEDSGCGGSPSIILSIKQDKSLNINGKLIPRKELKKTIRDIYSTRLDKTLFLRASTKLKYKDIVDIMDIMQGAGVTIVLYTNHYEE